MAIAGYIGVAYGDRYRAADLKAVSGGRRYDYRRAQWWTVDPRLSAVPTGWAVLLLLRCFVRCCGCCGLVSGYSALSAGNWVFVPLCVPVHGGGDAGMRRSVVGCMWWCGALLCARRVCGRFLCAVER